MNENKAMTVGDWIITFIVTAIPLIGFILLFVWAFSSDTNLSKKNWAKALLIFYVILIVIWIFVGTAILGVLGSFS
jgi:hypothetical protein|tara:strand:+ start:133 stop:360 length:228 start_codon:yes stop_codon:yes gene_type:complete